MTQLPDQLQKAENEGRQGRSSNHRMNIKNLQRCVSILLVTGLAPVLADIVLAGEPEAASSFSEALAAASKYETGQSSEPLRRIEDAVRNSTGDAARRRQVERGLIQMLEPESTFEARTFACSQLGVIGSAAALPALSRLLNEEETAAMACLALGTYPEGKADAVVREALKWATGKVRVQLINTVGDRRDAKAVSLLSRFALDSDPQVLEAAIGALAKIQSPAARKVLASMDGRADPTLSLALAEAKLRVCEGLMAAGHAKRAKVIYEDLLASSEVAAVRRSALAALLTLDADGGEARIVETLSGPDTALRPVALAAVSRVRSPGASEKFGGLLHHLNPEEQALMIEALAGRNDDAARLTIAKALSSTEPLARRAAIAALGQLGDPYFSSLLARTASLASEPAENRALESALVSLKGGKETDTRLLAELKTSSPKPRMLLIGVVSRRMGSAANPVLLEDTANTDPAVARAAFRAIAKTGTADDAGALLAKLSLVLEAGVRSEGENAAAQVLGKIEDPAKRSLLVCEALAKAKTVPGRISYINLLPVGAEAQALAALKDACNDPETDVRNAAVRTLAEWPDRSAWETLLLLYRQPDRGTTHGLALRGLVRLAAEQNTTPSPALLQQYQALLTGARDAADLRLILAALGGYGQPEALQLALPLLSNPNVRPEAIAAVKRIAEASKAQNPQLAEEALKRLPSP